MKISTDLKGAMVQLGIAKLRDHQIKPLNHILRHRDTMVIAPTSAGKSLLYQLPALIWSDTLTLVIEPTLALMHDQVQKLQKLDIPAAYLDSMMSESDKKRVLHNLATQKIHILYVTPERLQTKKFQEAIAHYPVGLIAVDECHCVLDWGYSFRSAYLQIGDYIDSLPNRPTIVALTATADEASRNEIAKRLSMKKFKCYVLSLERKNLIFMKKGFSSQAEKQSPLFRCLKKYKPRSAIVYCNTQKAVEAVAKLLKEQYSHEVAMTHAGMGSAKRYEQEKKFLTGKRWIMVATSAYGMGVDLSTVDLMIHFNMPLSLVDYYQQAGRAGRNGSRAHCMLFYCQQDYKNNWGILKNSEAPDLFYQRLDQMWEFCQEQHHCLVCGMLEALGEYKAKRCNHCTACQKERRA